MTTAEPPALLPLPLMARRLRVSTKWLANEAKAGRVPCLPTGSGFLFAPDALEAALARRAAQTEGAANG